MTVSELIKALQALPQDINIQVMTSEGDGPSDIVQVSRGTWSSDIDPEDIDEDDEDLEEGFESMIDPEDAEFVQDDETGKIAVLVTW
jgi:hypothetical protein